MVKSSGWNGLGLRFQCSWDPHVAVERDVGYGPGRAPPREGPRIDPRRDPRG
jgi:hypothetical protein